MNETIFGVVGATGKTGSRVITRLEKQGFKVIGLARNTRRIFDWSERSTWRDALKGIDAVYVTYYPDLALPQAEEDIRHFISVAKTSGIQHIVLLSGRGEEGAQRAEDLVSKSGLSWNVVRASWFMQNFSESFMLDGLKRGELALPKTNASEPFIDVDDIADVVVASLTQKHLRNQLLEITGPQLLSFAECVDLIASASNREISLSSHPLNDYLHAAKAEGLPEQIAMLMEELFGNVLDGRNELTTDTVERVLDRPARSFNEYVHASASRGIWAEASSH